MLQIKTLINRLAVKHFRRKWDGADTPNTWFRSDLSLWPNSHSENIHSVLWDASPRRSRGVSPSPSARGSLRVQVLGVTLPYSKISSIWADVGWARMVHNCSQYTQWYSLYPLCAMQQSGYCTNSAESITWGITWIRMTRSLVSM